MSFSWTGTVATGLTVWRDPQITQLQTNINHCFTQAGRPAWTWTTIVPAVGTEILSANITELRTALDYLKDHLLCTADNTNYLSPANSGANPSDCPDCPIECTNFG